MKRSGPIRRKAPLRRHRGVKPINIARAERRRFQAFGPQAGLARSLPCTVCGKPPPSDPAHVISRGAGGKDEHVVPLCRAHHMQQHGIGIKTFQERHGVDLEKVARELQHQVVASGQARAEEEGDD